MCACTHTSPCSRARANTHTHTHTLPAHNRMWNSQRKDRGRVGCRPRPPKNPTLSPPPTSPVSLIPTPPPPSPSLLLPPLFPNRSSSSPSFFHSPHLPPIFPLSTLTPTPVPLAKMTVESVLAIEFVLYSIHACLGRLAAEPRPDKCQLLFCSYFSINILRN